MITAIALSTMLVTADAPHTEWSLGVRLSAQSYDNERDFGVGEYRHRLLASPGLELQVPVLRRVSARTYIDYLEAPARDNSGSESGMGAGIDLLYHFNSLYVGAGARRFSVGDSSSTAPTATLGYRRELSPHLFWRVEGMFASDSDFDDYAVIAALNFRFGAAKKRLSHSEDTRADYLERDHFYLDVPEQITEHFQIHFDFDSAFLTSAARQILAIAAEYMRRDPNTDVHLIGHTDLVGSEDYNQQLSEERASTVSHYLVEHFGIAVERITFEGQGMRMPLVNDLSPEAGAKNRRVEIFLK
ncbi:MAG: OmpA family protein [Idiomarina sp.]|nr:OmpA family protein [Idiomarina sp.]